MMATGEKAAQRSGCYECAATHAALLRLCLHSEPRQDRPEIAARTAALGVR